MTHRPIRTLPDGTRRYKNGTKYKPKETWARGQSRKPADPRAQRFHGIWFLPFEVLADDDRAPLPETRSDEIGYSHTLYCSCVICERPAVDAWKWRHWKKPPRS